MHNTAIHSRNDYGYGDLLTSRTDNRGVIQAANRKFQRVCGYEWPDLNGAPHKIVRHPDMPKALFHLIWQKLGRAEPVGGYIKNSTKDGGHYWVFATIVEMSGGFLSMRFKPSPDAVAMIEPMYAQLLEAEKTAGHTPEKGAIELLGLLEDIKQPSYEAFMSTSLAQELAHRDTMLNNTEDLRINRLMQLEQEWPLVGTECARVDEAYGEFGVAPLNMRIQAAQLDERGVALGVISSNFAELAGNIHAGLLEITGSVPDVARTISDSLFLTCAQRLMAEAEITLGKEVEEGAAYPHEIKNMHASRLNYESKALVGLQDVNAKLTQFLSLIYSIKRNLSGLSVTRVMSAIENAQVPDSNDNSISAIIEELRVFQEVTDTGLMTIQHHLSRFSTELHRAAQRGRKHRMVA